MPPPVFPPSLLMLFLQDVAFNNNVVNSKAGILSCLFIVMFNNGYWPFTMRTLSIAMLMVLEGTAAAWSFAIIKAISVAG